MSSPQQFKLDPINCGDDNSSYHLAQSLLGEKKIFKKTAIAARHSDNDGSGNKLENAKKTRSLSTTQSDFSMVEEDDRVVNRKDLSVRSDYGDANSWSASDSDNSSQQEGSAIGDERKMLINRKGFTKFMMHYKLLMMKNYWIFSRNKKLTLIQLIAPIVFCLLIVFF